MRVIASTPQWSLSGVNTLLHAVLRDMHRRGHDTAMVLTNPQRRDAIAMPAPPTCDVPFHDLGLKWYDGLAKRLDVIGRYLRDRAPCIYMPGYDQIGSALAPALPRDVRIVAGLYSDEPVYYESAQRLGDYLDAIVCVSSEIHDKLLERQPDLAPRAVVIDNGVPWPAQLPARDRDHAVLRVVYAARLMQYQKRVMDIPAIIAAAERRGVPVELTIVGDGPERQALADACPACRMIDTMTLDALRELFEQQDVFLLTSEFEGLPMTLLEAMSRGCVPVVTDIASGVGAVVQHGKNGLLAPVGDAQTFADHLASLHHDRDLLERLRVAAHEAIRVKHLREQDMGAAYAQLLQRLSPDSPDDGWQRPAGNPLLPKGLRVRPTDHLPRPIRWAILSMMGAK